MGEAAIFDFREVHGVIYFSLYISPTGMVLLKILRDLVYHTRASIYGRDRNIGLDFGAIGGEKSGDICAASAADVDDAVRLGEGKGSIGSS